MVGRKKTRELLEKEAEKILKTLPVDMDKDRVYLIVMEGKTTKEYTIGDILRDIESKRYDIIKKVI